MRKLSWPLLGLALTLGLVVLLAWQNRGLREERDWLSDRALNAYVGMYVPKVATADLQGRPVTLGEVPADFQVLYFFTPQCPYCRASSPMIRALAERIRANAKGRIEMIGVGNDGDATVRDYAREQQFDFPIVATQDRRTVMLYRARSVPLVLVIGPDGRVRHSQLGAIDAMDQVGSILAAMRQDARSAATPSRSPP